VAPPVIGISMYPRNEEGEFHLPATYVDAVRMAGGLPVLLPPGETHLERLWPLLDGMILAGGGDIAPEHYGGDYHESIYAVDSDRDAFELALAKTVVERQLPALGICRGLQVLNVACGGTLIAHVPDVVAGDTLHRHESEATTKPTRHPVFIEPDSRLRRALGTDTTEITSWHHQAVDRLPAGWRVVAKAPDGTIEAIECEAHPWLLAVQWHPEMSPECPTQRSLFQSLIRATQK